MKFGIMFANVATFVPSEGALALGKAAEDAGFESLWTVEHVVIPDGYKSEYPYDKSGRMPGGENSSIPDPLIWLSHIAATTSTIKLATGILIVPQRNPVVLAKQCATLDVLANGRFILGVGAGWLEEEFDALGVPFEDRGRRLDDYIGGMRELWSGDPATYKGEFMSVENVHMNPKPPNGSIPIVVGGHSKAAARRAGRIGDGFFPGRGDLDELGGLIEVMREAATEAGRDPSTIEVTTGGVAAFAADPIEALKPYIDAGVDRFVVPPLSFNPADLPEALGRFSENVIAKLS